MTIELSRYSAAWKMQKASYKGSVGWCCERCQKPCRRSGEEVADFLARIPAYLKIYAAAKPKSFELHLAHLDQNPQNDAPDNWMALCTTCHLEHDRPFIQANLAARLERNGQYVLPFVVAEVVEP